MTDNTQQESKYDLDSLKYAEQIIGIQYGILNHLAQSYHQLDAIKNDVASADPKDLDAIVKHAVEVISQVNAVYKILQAETPNNVQWLQKHIENYEKEVAKYLSMASQIKEVSTAIRENVFQYEALEEIIDEHLR